MMKRENLDYRSAVELLAARAGITLPEDEKKPGRGESVKRERLLNMNREAARFYHATLYSPAARRDLSISQSAGFPGRP